MSDVYIYGVSYIYYILPINFDFAADDFHITYATDDFHIAFDFYISLVYTNYRHKGQNIFWRLHH